MNSPALPVMNVTVAVSVSQLSCSPDPVTINRNQNSSLCVTYQLSAADIQAGYFIAGYYDNTSPANSGTGTPMNSTLMAQGMPTNSGQYQITFTPPGKALPGVTSVTVNFALIIRNTNKPNCLIVIDPQDGGFPYG